MERKRANSDSRMFFLEATSSREFTKILQNVIGLGW
jgi:hypothetical protein